MVMGKRRSLKLTFTNLSKSTKINYHRDMFKTGKFFNHPVNTINHGEKMTILVMNTEGLHLAGVSGGMTLELKSGIGYLLSDFRNISFAILSSELKNG